MTEPHHTLGSAPTASDDDAPDAGSPARRVEPGRRALRWAAAVGAAAVLLVAVLVLTSPTTTARPPAPRFSAMAALGGGGLIAPPYGTPTAPGRPTVLVFFASWCTPCQRELPMLGSVLPTLPGRSQVAVIGIDVSDSDAAGAAFLRRSHLQLTAAGADPNDQVAAGAFALPGLPDTIFISATGQVVLRHSGELSAAQLRAGWAALRSAATT